MKRLAHERSPISSATGLKRGLLAGLAAGTVWWLIETAANWAFGGVIPPLAALTMLGLDLALGAVCGAALGVLLTLIGEGASAPALALSLAAAYGMIRMYEPPGLRAEALFAVLATVSVPAAVRLVGRERRDWLAFLHLTLVATAATALGKTAIGEMQSTYFGKTEPTGIMLPLILAGLPLAGVAADRLLAFVLRKHGLRFGAEVAAALLAVFLFGHPLPIKPLDDPSVAAPPPVGSPDIILIVMDTTRADHLSTYGYERETSPNLTAFAGDALNFVRASSPAQWTVPGHASLFTGMYPTRHGAHYAGDWDSGPVIYGRKRVFPLPSERVTLAEVLRENGYSTGAFVANFANLYRGFGMAQGFQRYEDQPGLLLRPVPHAVRFVQRFVPTFFKKPFRSAPEINAAALAWLDRAPADRPVFVFLNYLEPHHWLAPPPFDRWSRELTNARLLAQRGLFTHAIPAGLSEAERTFVTANYDGQLAAMDVALGELLAALKERGRYEQALVIVTADHGELLGEHDQVGHGGRMMYEGLLHIPMVVKLPGSLRPRGEINEPVQLVDVLPTVLEVLGLPLPQGVQGEPLQRVKHEIVAEEHINPEFVSYYGQVYNRALRVFYDGSYKLIATSRGERKLFDLASDVGEDHDLSSREPEKVREMERRLDMAMSAMLPTVAARAPQ